jgi:hypothetical protein
MLRIDVGSPPRQGERIKRLRALGCQPSEDLLRGLDPRRNALLAAPEGTTVLLTRSRLVTARFWR